MFSLNIAPPPTGKASVSYSSCRAVPIEPNNACQPEMAPHAIVTNSIGQIGWIAAAAWSGTCNTGIQLLNTAVWNVTALRASALPSRPHTPPTIAPSAESPMVRNVTQKPMQLTGCAKRQMGRIVPRYEKTNRKTHQKMNEGSILMPPLSSTYLGTTVPWALSVVAASRGSAFVGSETV